MARDVNRRQQCWGRMRSRFQSFILKLWKFGRVQPPGFVGGLLIVLFLRWIGLEVIFGPGLKLVRLLELILVLAVVFWLGKVLRFWLGKANIQHQSGLPLMIHFGKALRFWLGKVRVQSQAKLPLSKHLRCVLPEDCVSVLAAIYQRLIVQYPRWFVLFCMVQETLKLMWGIYIQIKLDNLWLPKKGNQVEDE